MTLLTAVTSYLQDRHAVSAQFDENVLDHFEFCRLNDGLNFCHFVLLGWQSVNILSLWPASGSHDVAFFAVQGKVESFDFLLRSNSQTEQHVADLQNDQSADHGKRPCNGGSDELINNLAAMTIHQTERKRISLAVLQTAVHGVGGKDAGKNRAQRSACAVDAKGVQRDSFKSLRPARDVVFMSASEQL
jgi:hypothetical protein